VSNPEEITPEGSSSPVYLDTTPLPPSDPLDLEEGDSLRAEAVQKLIENFGFTEAMARAVVGT
jgi:hypothetical protein